MTYDPGFQAAARETFIKLGFPLDRPTPRFPRGDVNTRRNGIGYLRAMLSLTWEEHPEIEKTIYTVPGYQQAEIQIHGYKNASSGSPTPAVLYLHGGGMIFGSPLLFENMIETEVVKTGVPHFSVGYRLAPEYPHPTPVEDCYAALLWLSTHAKELNIDAARIGIVGLSAGGGLAAGVSLLARDRKLDPPIARQILFCPMLDDRNTETDPGLLPLMSWSWDDNWTGWNALLGDAIGTESVSEYAAPARAKDLRGLPYTYIDVGTLDVFAEEDGTYAKRLAEAGVDVDWNLYEGVPHGFEFRGLGSSILEKALSNRRAAIRGL